MSTLFSNLSKLRSDDLQLESSLKLYLRTPLNNSFLSAQAAQTYYVGFPGLKV